MAAAIKDAGKGLPVIDDLYSLFVSATPLLDVRAPVEFQAGAFPNATNCPLMDDQDRAEIGKRYKQQGQDAAIALGLARVSGATKMQRVAAWQAFAHQYPDGVLYCFRGGLRSRIAQQWLFEATGIDYPRVQGGYKRMRRFLLQQLEVLPGRIRPVILSGRTGAGKTLFLHTFQQQVDLEGLANHRGSAFGGQPSPQPSQIQFENALAVGLLRKVHQGMADLLLEDEGRKIGSLHVPDTLFQRMAQAPVVVLEVPDAERVEHSYREYVEDALQRYIAWHGGDALQGQQAFQAYWQASLDKIQQRLGGERYQHANRLLQQAFRQHNEEGGTAAYYDVVRFLLLEYYDPMYDYQLSRKRGRVIYAGGSDAVRAFLAARGIT